MLLDLQPGIEKQLNPKFEKFIDHLATRGPYRLCNYFGVEQLYTIQANLMFNNRWTSLDPESYIMSYELTYEMFNKLIQDLGKVGAPKSILDNLKEVLDEFEKSNKEGILPDLDITLSWDDTTIGEHNRFKDKPKIENLLEVDAWIYEYLLEETHQELLTILLGYTK